jgi:hypothetical protein
MNITNATNKTAPGIRSLAQFFLDRYGIVVNIGFDLRSTADDPLVVVYTLSWGDAVANEWTEEYLDFSTLMLRLAVLVKCAESNTGFTTDEHEFVTVANEFLSEQTA